MTQQLRGRRGAVFSVRVTEEERAQLEALQARGGGPRSLGAWMRWAALNFAPAPSGAAVPAQRAEDPAPLRPGGVVLELAPEEGRAAPAPGRRRWTQPPPPLDGGSARVVPGPPPTTPAEVLPAVGERVILDLCGGCGAWSKPYRDAGYDVRLVTLPEDDVRTYVPPARVWGVLAAPPCTEFSTARRDAPGARTRDFIAGMECVNACLRIVMQTRPRWWALENPTGFLSRFLGTPRDTWQPCDFGDPWTKHTALWGDFTLPRRGPFVAPLGGGPFCKVCDPKGRERRWCSNAAHRAVTPQGFARAFCEANP